jgi:hypothetical protein
MGVQADIWDDGSVDTVQAASTAACEVEEAEEVPKGHDYSANSYLSEHIIYNALLHSDIVLSPVPFFHRDGENDSRDTDIDNLAYHR